MAAVNCLLKHMPQEACNFVAIIARVSSNSGTVTRQSTSHFDVLGPAAPLPGWHHADINRGLGHFSNSLLRLP